jgi:phosphatidylglycerol lysyltransferase
MVGVLAVLGAFGLTRLLRPAERPADLPAAETLARALPIIRRSRDTTAYLALLGDKELLMSESGEAFLMFGVEGRCWAALGDPIGPEAEREALVWRFVEMARRQGGWPVFYEVGSAKIDLYIELGLSLMKLGECARVHLPEFTIQGNKHRARNLRHARNQVEKDGCRFEIIPAGALDLILPELEAVSRAWLDERRTREKGFSLGFFDPDYLRHFPLGLVKKDGAIFAFANVLEGADREELSVDLMRHRPDAPAGVMDYLFTELLSWGREQGYQWFNLGMAPLAGLEPRMYAPLWNRVASLIYHYGETYYNFQGLKQYKDKFEPEWTSRYLASPGGLALPTILANLATLTARGLKGVIGK